MMRSMRATPSFDSLAAVLDRLAPRLGLQAKLWELRLQQRWPVILGDLIAAHTHPERIRFKKLYVLVENSVWSQQLTFLKRELLEKITRATEPGLVEDLVFRVGLIPTRASPTAAGTDELVPSTQPSPEQLADAAAHASAVSDPELRARLTTVIATALALPRRSEAKDRSRVP
jgi:hypothetical protein